MGKSFLLEDFINKTIPPETPLYFRSFSDDSLDNINIITQIVSFVLLPYVSPQDINVDYIKSIESMDAISKKNYIKLVMSERVTNFL